MFAQYKPNEADRPILDDITDRIRASLDSWYGARSRLDSGTTEIRSYWNSFLLRYPITTSTSQKKHILVKIRRKPKMTSLAEPIQADIHRQMDLEFKALKFFFDRLTHTQENFGAIRPLDYLE